MGLGGRDHHHRPDRVGADRQFPRPQRAGPADRHDQCGTGPGRADRGQRARPGARRRSRARARWCCSPVSRASASRPCCSTSPSSGRPARAARRWWSPARSRSARSGCAPSAWAPCTSSSTWPPRATWARCSAISTRSSPGLLVLDSVQTISTPGTEGVPGGVTQVRAVTAALVSRRQGARHRDRAGRPRHQGRPGGRPAGAGAPGRRGAALRGRQALLAAAGARREEPVRRRPTRSAASRCTRAASPAWPTRPGCS